MKSATFRVVTQGLQPAYSAELAVRQLAGMFKCSERKIAPLLGSTPVSVKKGLTFEDARKYMRALERCGCLCTMEEEPAPVRTAAALMLSDERLRRLQPQLFDAAHGLSQASREQWLASIADTLAQGDSRAAVVVDAASAVVACYADELDCVALLKFDPAVSLVHGWQDGTRLLAANSYVSRDLGMAPDLQPGTGDTGRWGNLWPLIADLLTDDHASLAARKLAITDLEWERTWQLGRSALARGVARNGRPLQSARPAPVLAAATRQRAGWRRRALPGLAAAAALVLGALALLYR